MKGRDLAALAALAGGAYALSQAKNGDSKTDPYAVDRALTREERAAIERKVADEELNPQGRTGRRRTALLDGSGRPVSSLGGYSYTEGKEEESDVSDKKFRAANDKLNAEIDALNKKRSYKKIHGMKSGGKVSSASSRGDGIAQRGKTRGKMY